MSSGSLWHLTGLRKERCLPRTYLAGARRNLHFVCVCVCVWTNIPVFSKGYLNNVKYRCAILTKGKGLVSQRAKKSSHWVGGGQGGLACCSPWGRKESDTTKRQNWTELNCPVLKIILIYSQIWASYLFIENIASMPACLLSWPAFIMSLDVESKLIAQSFLFSWHDRWTILVGCLTRTDSQFQAVQQDLYQFCLACALNMFINL